MFQPSIPFAQFHSGYDLDSRTRLKHNLDMWTRLERAGLPYSHQTPKEDFDFLSLQAGTSAYTMVLDTTFYIASTWIYSAILSH